MIGGIKETSMRTMRGDAISIRQTSLVRLNHSDELNARFASIETSRGRSVRHRTYFVDVFIPNAA